MALNQKPSIYKQYCSCHLVAGRHFESECARVGAALRQKAYLEYQAEREARHKAYLERREAEHKAYLERQARREQREAEHQAYLERKARREQREAEPRIYFDRHYLRRQSEKVAEKPCDKIAEEASTVPPEAEDDWTAALSDEEVSPASPPPTAKMVWTRHEIKDAEEAVKTSEVKIAVLDDEIAALSAEIEWDRLILEAERGCHKKTEGWDRLILEAERGCDKKTEDLRKAMKTSEANITALDDEIKVLEAELTILEADRKVQCTPGTFCRVRVSKPSSQSKKLDEQSARPSSDSAKRFDGFKRLVKAHLQS